MTQDKMQKPGDVQVSSVWIYSSENNIPLDISTIWENITFFEDMTKSYILGQLVFEDTQNLIQTTPILMNDRIVIRYKTASAFDYEERVGYIVDIPTRTGSTGGEGSETVVLEFVSAEFVRSKSLKVRKSYNNTFISDMVKDIHTQYLAPASGKSFTVADTLVPDSKVIPNISPIAAINWLAKWAKSPLYRDAATFQFFENRTGYFFVPIEALIDKKNTNVVANYSVSIANSQEILDDVQQGFTNMSVYIPQTKNHLVMLEDGTYASTILIHDPILRTIQKKSLNYYDDKLNQVNLNDYKIHNDERFGVLSDSCFVIVPKQSYAYSKIDDISASRTYETKLARMSKLAQFDNMSMRISVPGDSERTIGEVIHLDIPSRGLNNYDEYRGQHDKYLSGRYLIHSLRQEITRNPAGSVRFTTHMRVIKDSMFEKLPTKTIFDKTTIPT